MKKALMAAAVFVALPVMAQAQTPAPGVYIGAEGGANWLLNTTIGGFGVTPQTGWAAGGVIGYDFVGPRVEIEALYHDNTASMTLNGIGFGADINQISVMANLFYDFNNFTLVNNFLFLVFCHYMEFTSKIQKLKLLRSLI